MQKSFLRGLSLYALAVSSFCLILPAGVDAKARVVKKALKRSSYHLTISAIPGADEKDFSNPVSRCLTSGMKALHQKTIKQMDADIAKWGTGHEKAVKDYTEKIDIVWSAMEQPYCGYGSQGLTAVKHSYVKSVDHIRSAFFAAVKS